MDADLYFEEALIEKVIKSRKNNFFLIDTKSKIDKEAVVVGFKNCMAIALAKGLNHKAILEQVDQLRGEILQFTYRHYKHLTVRRFVNNLAYRDLEDLFRFTTNQDIDPTNNISERELRHLVMIRRISHGSRSPRGAAVTAQLTSIIQTLRMQKVNVLQGLQNILGEFQTSE